MTMHPTAEEIRALEGVELAELACTLGLAPEGVYRPDGCEYFYDEDELTWRPWSRIAQADAVFRQLRGRPQAWQTRTCWNPWAKEGLVMAFLCTEPLGVIHVSLHCAFGLPGDTEAEALLRVSVLAAASERQVAP